MKKIFKISVPTLFVFLLFLGYTPHDGDEGGILSVQLNTTSKAQPVQLSQFMDVSRVVALETNEKVMLPERFEIALTDKFIVTLPDQLFRNISINQFDRNGKFVRVLARSGRGPSEYTGINVYAVDDKNEILYFMHSGDKEHIQRIDLNTGKFQERIVLPVAKITRSENLVLSDLHVLPDGTLACTPRMQPGKDQLHYKIFYLTQKGEFAGGMRAYPDDENGFINPYARISVVNGELHYFGNTPDTLFRVKGAMRNPLMVINTPTPFTVSSKKGHALYGLMETPSFLVSMMIHYPTEKADAAIWKEPLSGIFLLNKENGHFTKISSLNIDPLNIEMAPTISAMYRFSSDRRIDFSLLWETWFQNIFTSNNLGVIKIDALSFKKEAAKIISGGTASANVLKQVKELDARIKEDSNPVLVIGKWK